MRELLYALSQPALDHRFMRFRTVVPRPEIQEFLDLDHRNDVTCVNCEDAFPIIRRCRGCWRRRPERVGASHYGADRQETGEHKAQRTVREEMQRLGWAEDDLPQRRKGDAGKVRVARRLRRGNDNEFKVDRPTAADGHLDVRLEPPARKATPRTLCQK
ncbi:MAG: hypothetical protein ABSC03_08285 [Verrucomicrobiota bacterium]|jgi:hypothetical protein